MDMLLDILPLRVAQQGFENDLAQEDGIAGFSLVPIGVVVC
jgi:hypothetical protein